MRRGLIACIGKTADDIAGKNAYDEIVAREPGKPDQSLRAYEKTEQAGTFDNVHGSFEPHRLTGASRDLYADVVRSRGWRHTTCYGGLSEGSSAGNRRILAMCSVRIQRIRDTRSSLRDQSDIRSRSYALPSRR